MRNPFIKKNSIGFSRDEDGMEGGGGGEGGVCIEPGSRQIRKHLLRISSLTWIFDAMGDGGGGSRTVLYLILKYLLNFVFPVDMVKPVSISSVSELNPIG